jgi:hypothetical protein
MNTLGRIRCLLGLAALALAGVAGATTVGGTTTLIVPAGARVTPTEVPLPPLPGTAVLIAAGGAWDVCGGRCPSGPAGSPDPFYHGFCILNRPAGELLGSLDGGKTVFEIGDGVDRPAGSGLLSFVPNDCDLWHDNSGALTVFIVEYPTAADACREDGWKFLSRRDGLVFKDQADCGQYVETFVKPVK